MKKRIILLVFFAFIAIQSYADVIRVPEDQSKIQWGIMAANDGDTVLVSQGTYIENINFYGKKIFVSSNYSLSKETLDIENTIIDGNKEGSVIIFNPFLRSLHEILI